IYNAMINNNLVLVDEIDSKFHTLLSKFLFRIFHAQSEGLSQVIAADQDVNLMNTDCFRRDQNWFVDNDVKTGSTKLNSLVENKQKQRS
ncbi:UNVERIFIED_CONTAM: ATP-binding protein, partial [Salmonella enterica subsp. enterica serovar Indiana]